MDHRITRMVKKSSITCTATIRKCLREAKLFARNPRKVLLLKKDVLKRLEFAKDWPKEKWRNILWTDQSKIVLIGSKCHRRPRNTEFKPQYAVKTVKHGGASIMICGCFSYFAFRPIYRIPGTMDQFEYIKIWEEVMLPYAEEEMPLKWVFQQDNNPKHTSKWATSWFQTNKIDLEIPFKLCTSLFLILPVLPSIHPSIH
uniref:Transposase Tc1-like domain-containing protein n=1 Tax=Electrophorus electricus TaxID=8005 RepID=A0A4W4EQ21_ELEEL